MEQNVGGVCVQRTKNGVPRCVLWMRREERCVRTGFGTIFLFFFSSFFIGDSRSFEVFAQTKKKKKKMSLGSMLETSFAEWSGASFLRCALPLKKALSPVLFVWQKNVVVPILPPQSILCDSFSPQPNEVEQTRQVVRQNHIFQFSFYRTWHGFLFFVLSFFYKEKFFFIFLFFFSFFQRVNVGRKCFSWSTTTMKNKLLSLYVLV